MENINGARATAGPIDRDVFIVFSKREPTEARFALAIKDKVEELGRFAYEYEHWSWLEQGASGRGDDTMVDRVTLRSMLQQALVVIVVPPHGARASDGVVTELEMVADLQLPVILLQWDRPREKYEGLNLNVVHRYEVHGSPPTDRWVRSAGRHLAEIACLGCMVAELRTMHVGIGDVVLDQLPSFGAHSLTSFSLQGMNSRLDRYLHEPDYDTVANAVLATATETALEAFVQDWWATSEPALRFLRQRSHGEVRRPFAAMHDGIGALVKRAREKYSALNRYEADALQRRGLALIRFHDVEGAVTTLTEALGVAARNRSLIYAARALAHGERGELELALDDITAAVDCAETAQEECTARFNRAIFQAKLQTQASYRLAIEDFSRVIDSSPQTAIQLTALNYRAMDHANVGDIDAALADWQAVIERRVEAPRAAAQAYLNRAGQWLKLGRLPEADKDLTAVVDWADVSSAQRFRALEARAEVRERLRDFASAAMTSKRCLRWIRRSRSGGRS
jgi:tetratricopeptide (TPR) repeat protein